MGKNASKGMEMRTSSTGTTSDAMKENRAMRSAILVAILGNVLLFGGKYVAGVISGSVAIQADAWHTLSDVLTSIIVIVGYRFARKPADHEHPFGHGRYELVSTMLVGVFLFAVAAMFLRQGVMQIFEHTQIHYGPLAIWTIALSIPIKEGMAQYAFHVAKRINNPALRADGWHHRSDALSSVAVLMGIPIEQWFWGMDGALAIGISLLIAAVALRTFRKVSSAIAGEAPPKELTQHITDTVNETFPALNLQPHRIRWHNYIQHQEVTLHVVLPRNLTVGQAFGVAERLERIIREKYNISATIRVEPTPPHEGADIPDPEI